MKPRKLEKKLVLSKKTIADLKSGELRGVQGGGTVFPSCLGCPETEFLDCPTMIITICYHHLC